MSYTAIYTLPTAVSEPSGLIASVQYPNWYWLQRDGNRPYLYAIKIIDGQMQDLGGGVYYREVTLKQGGSNLSMVDFEDITLNIDTNQIVIADIGDNAHNRNGTGRARPFVCIFNEPNPETATTVEVGSKYQLKWPDGDTSFNRHLPDCESIFYYDGTYYLISKEGVNLNNEGQQNPRVMRLPGTLSSGSVNNLTLVASLTQLASEPKSVHKPMWADMSPDETRLAVGITGGATAPGRQLLVYTVPSGSEGTTGDARITAMVGQEPTFAKEWKADGSFYSMEAGAYKRDTSRDLVMASDNSRKVYYWDAVFYGDTAETPEGTGGCLLGVANQGGDLTRLATVETNLGRNFDVFSTYVSGTTSFPTSKLTDCITEGRILYHKRNGNSVATWQQSAAGSLDSYWTADATAVKNNAAAIRAAGLQVWVGSNHECAVVSDFTTPGGSSDPTVAGPRYVAHFENMVDVWRATMGADIDLVRFVVSSTAYSIAFHDYFQYFIPNASYYDFVGYTAYNDFSKWKNFYDTVRGAFPNVGASTPAYDRLASQAPGKPIIVVESSCQEQRSGFTDVGVSTTGKRDWFLEGAAGLALLPNIFCFVQWDSNAGVGGTPNPEKVWPVDSRLTMPGEVVDYTFAGTTFVNGFKPFALDTYLNGAGVPTPEEPSPTLGVVRRGQGRRPDGSAVRVRVNGVASAISVASG